MQFATSWWSDFFLSSVYLAPNCENDFFKFENKDYVLEFSSV